MVLFIFNVHKYLLQLNNISVATRHQIQQQKFATGKEKIEALATVSSPGRCLPPS